MEKLFIWNSRSLKLLQEIEPFASFWDTVNVCGPGEVCVKVDPSNLNVETRSIAPDEVKKGGKLIEVREPRTIVLMGVLRIHDYRTTIRFRMPIQSYDIKNTQAYVYTKCRTSWHITVSQGPRGPRLPMQNDTFYGQIYTKTPPWLIYCKLQLKGKQAKQPSTKMKIVTLATWWAYTAPR